MVYDGIEGSNNNPNQYSRIGMIIDILDENKISDDKTNKIVDNINAYFSVKIMWLDRGGVDGSFNTQTGIISLSYSHIGRGWGNQNKPSIGDIVHCSFRMGGAVVIDGYLPVDYYSKVMGVNNHGYYFRQIEEGEYLTKSKSGAEWYEDREGSFHIIVRDQEQKEDINFDNGISVIEDSIVKDNPLVEITVGKTFGYKDVGNSRQFDFNNEIKSGSNNSTRVSIQDYNSNTKIIIDSQGNIEITQPSGSNFKINGSDTAEILGSSSLALLSELKALSDKYNDLVTKYNLHTHPYVDSGSPSVTSATTSTGSTSSSPSGTQKLLGS